jgi:hypothetical protein
MEKVATVVAKEAKWCAWELDEENVAISPILDKVLVLRPASAQDN